MIVKGYYYNHSFDYQQIGHLDDAYDGDGDYVFCADPDHVYDDQAHMDFGEENNALCDHVNSFEFGYPLTEEFCFDVDLTPKECKEKVEREIPNWTVSAACARLLVYNICTRLVSGSVSLTHFKIVALLT